MSGYRSEQQSGSSDNLVHAPIAARVTADILSLFSTREDDAQESV
jgi:hypothetical protein